MKWIEANKPQKIGWYFTKVMNTITGILERNVTYFSETDFDLPYPFKVTEWLDESDQPNSVQEGGKEAVEFAEWLLVEGWEPTPKEIKMWFRYLVGEKMQKKSTTELYNLFKQQGL